MGTYPYEIAASFTIPKTPEIAEIAAAFYSSRPDGEYTLEAVEPFRVLLRRGMWERSRAGDLVPGVHGWIRVVDWALFPVVLKLLIQPRTEGLLLTVTHVVQTREPLSDEAHAALRAAYSRETEEFQEYLSRHGKSAVEHTAGWVAPETRAAGLDNAPAPSACSASDARASAAFTPTPPGAPSPRGTERRLSPWWPGSPAGSGAMCLLLALAFFAPMLLARGGPAGGILGAGLWYLIVVVVRYFLVVLPSRK